MKDFFSEEETEKIKTLLENSGVIAFPTDTVWGIGCLADNPSAVGKIYSIKTRDRIKPLILLGKNMESLLPYVQNMPDKGEKIIEQYMPGALTLVLKKNLLVADYVTSGFDTIGIRIPDCPVFLEVLEKCTETGVLATTSANISNMGGNIFRKEVIDSIGDKVDFVLPDFGFVPKGIESTVAGISESGEIKILRQGAVLLDNLG